MLKSKSNMCVLLVNIFGGQECCVESRGLVVQPELRNVGEFEKAPK